MPLLASERRLAKGSNLAKWWLRPAKDPGGAAHVTALRAVAGSGLIVAAWAAGEALAIWGGLPVPSAVSGMGILFATFLVWPGLALTVRPAGTWLLRRLPLFLYPVTAGFLTLPVIGVADLVRLVAVLLLSLILSMVVGVLIFQAMRRDDH